MDRVSLMPKVPQLDWENLIPKPVGKPKIERSFGIPEDKRGRFAKVKK